MCVAAGAGLLVSALSSVVGFIGQSQAASQQEAYERAQFEQRERERKQNAESAISSLNNEYAQANLQQVQRQEVAADEKSKVERDRLETAGTAIASSEGAGRGFNLILGDLFRQQGRFNSNIETQLSYDLEQGNAELYGLKAKADDRINSISPYIPRPVNRPNPLGLVADIAGAALKTRAKYNFT